MITSAYLNALQIHGGGNGIGVGQFARSLITREDRVERPRDHGSVDFTRYYSGQKISISGFVVAAGSSLEPLSDQIRQAVFLDSVVTLQIQRNGLSVAEQCVVTCDSLDMPQEATNQAMQAWSVELFGADPRLYSQTLTSTSATASSGVVSFTASNNGTVTTPVVWTVTGPVNANYSIANSTTGHSIRINTALASGHTLVVDTYAKTVKLDGGAEHPEYIDAVNTYWDGLAPGSNSVSISGSGFTNGTTKLQADFRDARA